MKKITFQDRLLKVVLYLIPATLLVLAVSWTTHATSNYLYKTFSEPFLANGEVVTHSPKSKLTTKPLQIEYTVLKVPSGKTTVAAK